MKDLVNKYENAKPLDYLPKKFSNDITVEEVIIPCVDCGRRTTELRGTIKEYSHCVEVEAAGVCYKCKTITWGRKHRTYDDGHIMSQNISGGWDEKPPMQYQQPFPSPIKILSVVVILSVLVWLVLKIFQ